MTVRLALRREAIKDLQEAFAWYEGERPGLGEVFLHRVRQAVHQIRENPRLFTVVLQSIRRAPIKRFPYGIYY